MRTPFGPQDWPPRRSPNCSREARLHVRGGGALRALLRCVAHLRALGERLESAALDGAVVHEQVLARLIRRDEAEALVVVEPLHGSGRHGDALLALCGARRGGCCKATTADAGTDGHRTEC